MSTDTTASELTPPPPQSWWRHNRLALLVVIPALVFAVGAAGSRYVLVSYPYAYSTAVTATDGQVSGGELPWWRTYGRTVTLPMVSIDLTEVRGLTGDEAKGLNPPADHRLWLIRTQWAADPQLPLRNCEVVVEGSDRKEYTVAARYVAPTDPTLRRMLTDSTLCVPAENPGPTAANPELGISSEDTGGIRPATWAKGMLVALPEGVSPRELRIGFGPPAYFAVPLA